MTGLKILITSSYYWPEEAGSAPYLTGLAEHLSEEATRHRGDQASRTIRIGARGRNGRLAGAETHAASVVRRWHYVPRRSLLRTAPAYEPSLSCRADGAAEAPPGRRDRHVPDARRWRARGDRGDDLSLALWARLPGPDGPGGASRAAWRAGNVWPAVGARGARLARGAARVGVIAEGFRSYFETGGVSPERSTGCGTGPPRRAERDRRRDEARLGWGPTSSCACTAGTWDRSRARQPSRGRWLLRGEGVRIVLSGDGNDRARLEREARELELDNVQFIELQGPGAGRRSMQARTSCSSTSGPR